MGNGEGGESGEDKKRILSGVCYFEIPPFCIPAGMVYLEGFVAYMKKRCFALLPTACTSFTGDFLPGGFFAKTSSPASPYSPPLGTGCGKGGKAVNAMVFFGSHS